MDFRITDEQELLLENLEEFLKRHVSDDVVNKMYETHSVPAEVSKAYLDEGFGLIGIPEEYGGVESDKTTLALMIEKINTITGGVTGIGQDILMMDDIIQFGNEEQKKMVVEKYKETGKPLFSLSISEPAAGSDNGSMAATVKKQPDGTYILNGTKTWVTNGLARDWVLVVAKDEDPSPQNRDMSLWFFPFDTPGVSGAPLHKIGQVTQPFAEHYYDNVILTEENRVGTPGKGFLLLMKNFEFERVCIVAQSLGLAQAAMEDATKYAAERIAFGKPITQFQLIQEKLTDMEVKLENVRNLLYKVCWKIDNDEPVQLDSALLKRYGPKACSEVADEALQIYAALGYTEEVRVGRIWVDLRGQQMAGGTNEIMVHIAGRQIVKKYAQ